MKREEAIIILGNIPTDGKDKCYSIAEYQEAKTMAIDALKFDIDQYCKEHFVVMVDEDVWDKAEKALEQEPKTGYWILADSQDNVDVENGNNRYICSECTFSDIHAKSTEVPYCWHCGARMEGET